jgi:biotin operon repressor
MRQLDRQAHQKVYTLQTEHDTQRQLAEIESGQGSDGPKVAELTNLDRATLRQANATRKMSKRDAMDKTLQLLASNPTASPTAIASEIGRSRQTVYDYFAELEANGRIHRNGSE